VSLEVHVPPARVHHDHKIADLKKASFHGPRGQVVGLTRIALRLQWELDVAARALGKAFCFWVNGIHLNLRYPTPDIYVAREYRPGSCPYRVILAHEKEHVRITRTVVRRYASRLRQELSSLAIPTRSRPTLVLDSPEQAQGRIQAQIEKRVQPLFQELQDKLRQANARLDTLGEYRRSRDRCSHW
jgi:hypothetical protein